MSGNTKPQENDDGSVWYRGRHFSSWAAYYAWKRDTEKETVERIMDWKV